jgi:YD repeat-containing protein
LNSACPTNNSAKLAIGTVALVSIDAYPPQWPMCVILSGGSFGTSENEIMSLDRDHFKLRGNVHTCQVERTDCQAEESRDSTTLEFRPDGAIAHRMHRNPDGASFAWTYEYDDAGRLINVFARSQSDPEQLTETHRYDHAGHKTKTLHLQPSQQNPKAIFCYGVECTDCSYSAPGTSKVVTHFDNRQRPAELLFLDGDEHVRSRVEFRYNKDGMLVEETQQALAELLPPELRAKFNETQLAAIRKLLGGAPGPSQRTHRYDNHGRRVETHSRMGQLGEDKDTVTYNDRGDPIAEVHERTEREYGMDDQGQLSETPVKERSTWSETCIHYDYDAQGNWVLKTVESRSAPDQDFIRLSFEQRVLDYFK